MPYGVQPGLFWATIDDIRSRDVNDHEVDQKFETEFWSKNNRVLQQTMFFMHFGKNIDKESVGNYNFNTLCVHVTPIQHTLHAHS